MNDKPLVSVIMPVYNGERFLREALDSVLLQRYTNLEILVVDDGSTDHSLTILHEYAAKDNRVRVLTQANLGVAAARNVAIAEARGEFVAPIDADDLWAPHKIERQMYQMLAPGEEAGLVYCWWAWLNEESAVVDRSPKWTIDGHALEKLVFINFTGNASVPLFRKSCLVEAGLYNPRLAAEQAGGCEDWEVALRIAARHPIRVVPKVLMGYRRRVGSMSSACETMRRSHEKVMAGIQALRPDLPRALFQASDRVFSMYLAGVAYWAGTPWKAVGWGLRAGLRLQMMVAPYVLRMLILPPRLGSNPTIMQPGVPLREKLLPGPFLPYDQLGIEMVRSLAKRASAFIREAAFYLLLKVWWWSMLINFWTEAYVITKPGWWWMIARFRTEAWRSERSKGTRKPRVWAMACWDFPIYSQTFVYREILGLMQGGFEVRFGYGKLGQRRDLPDECADVWKMKRRLLLTDSTGDWSISYFMRTRPDRFRALLRMVTEESGWEEDEVLEHRHFRQAFAFARLAEAWKPDYLHTYFFYEQALFGLVASVLLDLPRGVSCYADHMLEDHSLKLVGMHLRSCATIVATSKRIKSELEGLAGMPLDAAVVKPNGIDSRLYASAERRPSSADRVYKVVAVNRIHPKKGMTYLMEAALRLRATGVRCVVEVLGELDAQDAGTPAYFAGLKEFVRQHDLGSVVHFLGRQTASQVRSHLAQADIFVAPYVELANGDKDGIPTALLEAMASGCAAVVTDAGSISEVITHGVDGLMVAQCDSAGLAEGIARLCGDSLLRRRLVEAGKIRVESSFDVRVCEAWFHAKVRSAIAARDPFRFGQRETPSEGSLKIALLSYEYPPETGFGGIGTYTWYQARALARLGHEVHVLAGSRDYLPLRTTQHDGVLVHRYRGFSAWTAVAHVAGLIKCHWTEQRLANASSMAEGLRQLESRYQFDVIEMPECGAEGFLLNGRTQAKTLVRFHGPAKLIMSTYEVPWLDRVLCSRIEQVAIRQADRLTACSDFLAREVKAKLGVAKPVPVIYNGIDLSLFDQEPVADLAAAYGVPKGQVTILFAGRLELRKGIHLIGEIARSVLAGNEVTFLLAGDDLFGYVRKTLRPYLEEHGLSASVKILGKLGMTELRACARAVDIYLLPSLWENCPYSCLEAMASGRAVVCSNQGGMPELIQDGVNGLLAEVGSVASFSEAVIRLIQDKGLRRRLGDEARATVEQRFRDDGIARESAAVYAGMLEI